MLFDIICIICLIILFVYFIFLRFINTFIVKKRLTCNHSFKCLYCKRGIFFTKFKFAFYKSREDYDFCKKLLINYFVFSSNEMYFDYYSYFSKFYIVLIPNRKIKNCKKL